MPNLIQHAFKVAQHALIGETNDAIPKAFELPLASRASAVHPSMVAAIDFGDELDGGSEEIDDALTDDDLPAKGNAEA